MRLKENKTNPETIEIKNYRQEVLNSASLDLEWIPYEGQYQHSKTKIFAAAYCTNWGERIVFHISRYKSPNPEKSHQKHH